MLELFKLDNLEFVLKFQGSSKIMKWEWLGERMERRGRKGTLVLGPQLEQTFYLGSVLEA